MGYIGLFQTLADSHLPYRMDKMVEVGTKWMELRVVRVRVEFEPVEVLVEHTVLAVLHEQDMVLGTVVVLVLVVAQVHVQDTGVALQLVALQILYDRLELVVGHVLFELLYTVEEFHMEHE